MRRTLSFLITLMTLVSLGSCSVMHTVPRSDVTATSPESTGPFNHFSTPEGQPVVGYTTIDGRFHRIRGWARLEADTMVFHRPETPASGLTNDQPAITQRVPVADLKSVRIETIDTLRTALVVGALAVLVAAISLWGYYLNSMS
jgi:hypothetical protein